MNNLRIAVKLGIAFGLILVLTGVVAFMGYNGLNNVGRHADVNNDVNQMTQLILNARVEEKRFATDGFTVTNSDGLTAVDRWEELVLALDAKLASTTAKLREPEDIAQGATIDASLAEYRDGFTVNTDSMKIKDQAFADWGTAGWSITENIGNAMEKVIAPAMDTALAAEDIEGYARWSQIGTDLDQKVLQRFLLLRVNAVYLLATDTDAQWESYQTQLQSARDGLAEWKSSVAGETELELAAEEIDGYLDTYEAAGDSYYNALLAQRQADQTMLNAAQKTQNATATLNQSQNQALEESTQSAVTAALIATAIAIVIGLGAAIIITRGITTPMALLVKGSKALAMGDADITGIDEGEVAAMVARRDEIGDVGKAFSDLITYFKEMAHAAQEIAGGNLTANVMPKGSTDMLGNAFATMIDNLRNLISQVKNGAEQVSSASSGISQASEQSAQATQQVAATVGQIAQGTTEQTRATTETGAQVDQMSHAIDGIARGSQEQSRGIERVSANASQMSAAVHQVASNAKASADASAQAAATAQSGAETVRQSVEAMGAIKETVAEVGAKVTQMQEFSTQIGAIIETIDDIAEQTNLLALNAAIEAARAGEQGRGFAVVADEVRKLAERSGKATKEIATLIQNVQNGTTEMVDAMAVSLKQVQTGSDLAGEAGQALAQIISAATQVSGQVQEIAAAVENMSEAANELLAGVDSVSAVIEENTAASEELAASSGEISAAMESVSAVSEENAASVEEVSATSEEVSAQVQEIAASAQTLAEIASQLQAATALFALDASQSTGRSGKESSTVQVEKRNGQGRHEPHRETILAH